jgi:hypothetical protein
MKNVALVAFAALGAAAFAAPSVAQPLTTVTTVYSTNLNGFIGRNLFGAGNANLGVVSRVDPYAGVIGLTGRYGEVAMISTSMLTHEGWTLHAPTLTVGDIKAASDAKLAHPTAILASPNVIVIERPLG